MLYSTFVDILRGVDRLNRCRDDSGEPEGGERVLHGGHGVEKDSGLILQSFTLECSFTCLDLRDVTELALCVSDVYLARGS